MARAVDELEHLLDGGLALLGAAQMLGAAVISLQARKAQHGLGRNRLCQDHGGFAGLCAAAVLADVDFHQHIHGSIAGLRILQGPRQPRDAFLAIDGQGQPAALGIQCLGQGRHACQLGLGNDFVADEDIRDAALGQRLGLADFLHAVATGAGMLEQMGDVRALVQLGMRAPEHTMLLGKAGHALDIAVHGVQVYDQGGRVYAFDGLADQGLQMLRNVLHLGCLAEGVRYLPSLPKTGRQASRAGD